LTFSTNERFWISMVTGSQALIALNSYFLMVPRLEASSAEQFIRFSPNV
jgi:hypothetical protein